MRTVLHYPSFTMLRLILASRSPRRASLLRAAGWQPEIRESPFYDPDQPPADANAEALVTDLARQKAAALGPIPGALVLAADTVCTTPHGELLGKPRDAADATRMLHLLRAGGQQVLTGVSLLTSDGAQQSFVDCASVHCGQVSDAAINDYVASGHWRDKAGGYNLTELQDAGWPLTVDGDPDTVVGLPMRRLAPLLELHLGRPQG